MPELSTVDVSYASSVDLGNSVQITLTGHIDVGSGGGGDSNVFFSDNGASGSFDPSQGLISDATGMHSTFITTYTPSKTGVIMFNFSTDESRFTIEFDYNPSSLIVNALNSNVNKDSFFDFF